MPIVSYQYVADAALAADLTALYHNWYTATTVTNTNTVWMTWTQDTTVTNTNTVWMTWTQDTTGSGGLQYAVDRGTYPTPITPEEDARLLAEHQARLAAGAEVKRKAAELLQSVLNTYQRAEVERGSYFTVQSRASQRRYRVYVNDSRHGNVKELDAQGTEVASLCCAPSGMPNDDAFAAQKLFLECDEAEFRRRSNITCLRTHQMLHRDEEVGVPEIHVLAA